MFHRNLLQQIEHSATIYYAQKAITLPSYKKTRLGEFVMRFSQPLSFHQMKTLLFSKTNRYSILVVLHERLLMSPFGIYDNAVW